MYLTPFFDKEMKTSILSMITYCIWVEFPLFIIWPLPVTAQYRINCLEGGGSI